MWKGWLWWRALLPLGLLGALVFGGCQRTWLLPAPQKTCDPWANPSLGPALDTDLQGAATNDERAGWLGCLLLTEAGESKASVVRLHKDGSVWGWNGDQFLQEQVSVPSSGGSGPFRFQFYALRYPVLDVIKEKGGGSPSTISALLKVLAENVCPTFKEDSYTSCLEEGGSCRFMIEFRPTPPSSSIQVSALSPDSQNIRRTAGDVCALYTLGAGKSAEVAEPTQEAKPDEAGVPEPPAPEPRPEPQPEPRPEPPPEPPPPTQCTKPCLWNRKHSVTMQVGDRIKGIQHLARDRTGTKFMSAFDQFSMRFTGTSTTSYTVIGGNRSIPFHGDFQPITTHFSLEGDIVVRLRKLSQRNGYQWQGAAFQSLFESPKVDRTDNNSTGILGAGFLFDSRAFLIASKGGLLHAWKSEDKFTTSNLSLATLQRPDQLILGFAIHPKKAEWAMAIDHKSAGEKQLRSYSLPPNSSPRDLQRETLAATPTSMAYHPEGDQLLMATEKAEILTFSTDMKLEQTLKPTKQPLPDKIYKIFFSPDKELMASLERPVGAAAEQRVVRLWRRLPKKAGDTFFKYLDYAFFAPKSNGTPRMDQWGDVVFGEDCHTMVLGRKALQSQINIWRCE